MTKKTETVTIPRENYEALVEASQWLDALEAAGVDNWAGIEEAHVILREIKEYEDD